MAVPPVAAAAFPPPVGDRLGDGYQTLMVFETGSPLAAVPISFWDITVKPPGIDGGDAVMTSTMWNVAWHTSHPRVLKKATESTSSAAYDPQVYSNILSLINVEAVITVRFPDMSTVAFYGWLAKFEPGENKEGEMPTATVTVFVSNTDFTGAEEPPVYSIGALTATEKERREKLARLREKAARGPVSRDRSPAEAAA